MSAWTVPRRLKASVALMSSLSAGRRLAAMFSRNLILSLLVDGGVQDIARMAGAGPLVVMADSVAEIAQVEPE